ncbi:MAG: ShlB/FhaC/HecB family hemolysin secretion/activation protein [Burkholderiales bacterium]|nr:ShlB/FhaC/HecB family hemolysin secretion/activation protein [Burkholderiales bacterium]
MFEQQYRTIKPGAIAAMLGCALGSCALLAMAQPRPDAGTILETVKEPPALKRPSTGIDVPPPRPRMEAPPGIKVTVKGFRITGNTLFTETEIQPALSEFVNKELDFDGLSEAVRAVTSFYRSRGYFLAQAYLPRQELGGGVVEIHVLEGRMGKVNVKQGPSARLKPWIAEGYLRRIEPGSIATESGVERPLLLLGDLPATTVQSTLGPGANVGEADLTVEIGDDGRRVTGVAEVENFGNKYAGAIRAGGQVFLNNVFGIGDQFSARGLISQDKLTEVIGLSYSMPVTYWGTKAGFSFSQMRYDLGGSLASQRASGEADLASILLVHPIVRTRDLNVFGQISGELKELEDRVDAVLSLEQRRTKAVKLGIFGDSRDFFLGGGLNTFSFTVTSGQLKLLNPTLVQNDAIAFDTAGNYMKYNLEAQRVQRVSEALHAVVRLSVQAASQNLASVEKMSVGGPFGVRAYPVGEGLADEAALFSLEGRYVVPGFKLLQSELTLAAFIDGAHVRRYKSPNPAFDIDPVTFLANDNRRTLWGTGLGVRLGRAGDYSLSADFAWRIGSEQPKSDVPRHPSFWIRGVKWF